MKTWGKGERAQGRNQGGVGGGRLGGRAMPSEDSEVGSPLPGPHPAWPCNSPAGRPLAPPCLPRWALRGLLSLELGWRG